MIEVDVLVVGLGPAGAVAARVAAKTGCSVLAIDRKTQAGHPVQCAEFVPAMIGVEVERLNASKLQSITDMVTYVADTTAEVTPNFSGNMISRAAFDLQLVVDAIAVGAKCRFAAPLRDVSRDGYATLADGQQIIAKVMIGCDGPRSKLGQAIDQVNVDCVESRQITVPLLRIHQATDIFLRPEIVGGYAWLFPKGDKANLGIGVSANHRKDLKPVLARLHSELVVSGRVGADIPYTTGGAIPVGGMLKPVGQLGSISVFLAGDAAGLTNPITGAGISAAVISGKCAGVAAAKLLNGDVNAPADYEEELEDIFGPALRRALKRRTELMAHYASGQKPQLLDLKTAWIAYPEYWAA